MDHKSIYEHFLVTKKESFLYVTYVVTSGFAAALALAEASARPKGGYSGSSWSIARASLWSFSVTVFPASWVVSSMVTLL